MSSSDPLWYKDAIIYQVHVRGFFDSNDDGIGDFRGLLKKLDYIQELGVTAIWLQPFYPSPLRDDGYDIADYTNIHPDYGTLRDFRRFLRNAHRRGLRVITELVINHTSDQHPWFQAARRASPGSVKRDFYVWSETDKKFPETRIIFTDTETSNWAWDAEANAYYWHRFFSHQPDLNHNNPRVVRAVTKLMHFWLEQGVDGLRLDAIPYLCVREGTHNENLPETHEVIKQLRAAMDERFEHRMLLAEANQWPEDSCKYFGDGDECNMAFHFPLMPRVYMAVAQEDRHPLTDIMRQTPRIPDNCQWAIFLRNHDELTLEMVTDRERDYMYSVYASEPRMRCNVGIRRRLAPLMDNDRDKIELLNSVLLSMPGTPIVYYGDEIGMGDNIYLGDRNGVRTPMQWSSDRNGGFSRADPGRLFLPPIMDPVYGYQAVNVEAQQRSPSSLLNWMKRLFAVRKAHPAFGRGSFSFVYPGNRKILAYVREYRDEVMLCVANLSRRAQPVELDLARFKGRVPVELMGRTSFPPIGELPYLLTLPGYGFYWFRLTADAEAPSWHEQVGAAPPEITSLVITSDGWGWLLSDGHREELEQEALPRYLSNKPWFQPRGQQIERVELIEIGPWGEKGQWLLTLVRVHLPTSDPQLYFLPLALGWDDGAGADPLTALGALVICKVRRGSRNGVLFDALADEYFARSMINAIAGDADHRYESSAVISTPTDRGRSIGVDWEAQVRRLGGELSNTDLVVGDRLLLKTYRRLQRGAHPETEMGRYLADGGRFEQMPLYYGSLRLEQQGELPCELAVVQALVEHQGDGWYSTLDQLSSYLDACATTPPQNAEAVEELVGTFLGTMRVLGQRIGGLHVALAQPSDDPAFAPEPVTKEEIDRWALQLHETAGQVLGAIEFAHSGWDAPLAELAQRLLGERERLNERIDRDHAAILSGNQPASWVSTPPEGPEATALEPIKIRIHGYLTLHDVLLVKQDVYLTDFEGRPDLPLARRRAKDSPLRDVASMLRSLDHVARMALSDYLQHRPEAFSHLLPWVKRWKRLSNEALLSGYLEITEHVLPGHRDQTYRLVELFELQAALAWLLDAMDGEAEEIRHRLGAVLGLLEERRRYAGAFGELEAELDTEDGG